MPIYLTLGTFKVRWGLMRWLLLLVMDEMMQKDKKEVVKDGEEVIQD